MKNILFLFTVFTITITSAQIDAKVKKFAAKRYEKYCNEYLKNSPQNLTLKNFTSTSVFRVEVKNINDKHDQNIGEIEYSGSLFTISHYKNGNRKSNEIPFKLTIKPKTSGGYKVVSYKIKPTDNFDFYSILFNFKTGKGEFQF